MIHTKNEALNTDAVFFDAARLKKNNKKGVRNIFHTYEETGAVALENGDVVFSMYAPNAKECYVCGLPGSAMTDTPRYMEKSDDGYFRLTDSTIPAGYHYLEFHVDGTLTLNPQCNIGYGNHMLLNFFDKAEEDFYLLKNVPHGTLHMEQFYSETTGKTRSMWIYTPPGYNANADKTYPVLYLHHGGGECETGWFFQGKMNYIMDNLLAEGLCEEMLVVCNSLWCCDDRKEEEFLAGDFESMIVKDAVPFVEKNYRVKADPKYRCIAGLSMGSIQSLSAALTHLGFFRSVGMFSGAAAKSWFHKTDLDAIMADAELINKNIDLFFVGYGEQEEHLVEFYGKAVKQYEANGMNYVHYHTPGLHEWTVWRRCARELVKILFK